MTNLQVLNVAETPLKSELKKVLEQKDTEVEEMLDHEKLVAVTLGIMRFLRESCPVRP